MKRVSTKIIIALIGCLLMLCDRGYAQTGRPTKEEWLQEMQAVEQRITEYVNEQRLKAPVPQEVADRLRSGEKGEHISAKEKAGLAETWSIDYYRKKYFQLHPEAAKIYNPGRVSGAVSDVPDESSAARGGQSISCNGNFEDGNLSAYAGYRSVYTGYYCSFVPATSVAFTPVSLISSPDEFSLTNNVPDPIIPTLKQTHAGSAHAMRINSFNPCPSNAGINMLQRALPAISVSGKYRVNFSYALVLQDPANHQDASPFFVARVLNGSGVEVGTRICRVADATNPIYKAIKTPSGYCQTGDALIWRDWSCASIEFDAVPGQQYTVEFFASDCAAGGHFGYAYVDDICAELCCPSYRVFLDPSTMINPCFPTSKHTPVTLRVQLEDGSVVTSADGYTFSWTYTGGSSSSDAVTVTGSQFPVSVTVTDPVTGCVSQAAYQCPPLNCEDSITVVYDPVVWDPCKEIQRLITLRVKNRFGAYMTTAAGYTFFWEYGGGWMTGTADTLSVYPAHLPAYVTVIDPVTGCEYRDTFELPCCHPNVPANLGCTSVSGARDLFWDPVPNAAYYILKLTVNDPSCGCSELNPISTITLNVYDNDTTILNTLAACYSWQVAAVCPDGSVSAFSAKKCSSCPPPCDVPTGMNCRTVIGPDMSIQKELSWSAVPGAVGYEVDIAYNDPTCCGASGTILGIVASVSTTVYYTPYGQCYSWRVRTVCAGGVRSAWSTRACSCGPIVSTGRAAGPDDNSIQVTAMPNPASDHIDFKVQYDKDRYTNMTLSIYDLNGRELTREDIKNDAVLKVDVRKYNTGLYLYLVREKGRVLYSDKVMIQK